MTLGEFNTLFQMVLVASLGSHRKVLNDLCTHHREVRRGHKFRRSGVSQSDLFVTGGDPPMRATTNKPMRLNYDPQKQRASPHSVEGR